MAEENLFDKIAERYDSRMDYGIKMYDELPYERNIDICNADSIAMNSGHVIKYYSCKNNEKSYVISNHDDQIEQYLDSLRQEPEQEVVSNEDIIAEDNSSQLTEEQIQTLLADPEK